MCPVKTSTVTRLALPRSSPPVPPSAAQQGLMYTGSTTQRQWHVTVLRDLRRAQSEPLLPLLFWRSSHSNDWLLQLSASLAANSWSAARDLCVSATSFLRLSTWTARSPCGVSFVSIVAVKVAMSSFAATISALLALRSSSSLWAAINCFRMPMISPLCGAYPSLTPRVKKENSVERSSSETLVHGAFQPNGYVSRSRDMVTLAVYPRLFSTSFGIQSRRGYQHESHGNSRRSPALVLVLNFSPL